MATSVPITTSTSTSRPRLRGQRYWDQQQLVADLGLRNPRVGELAGLSVDAELAEIAYDKEAG
jgi:hypothetical protein